MPIEEYCAITPEQRVALELVTECFGDTSPEVLEFCRFLVEDKQGLVFEWTCDVATSLEPEQPSSPSSG